MTTPLTDAFPLVQSDGVTGRNNAHDLRRGLLAAILTPDVKTDPLAVRNGVFPHDFDSGGVTSLRVNQTTVASTSIVVRAGAFVSERSGQGPYLGWLETSAGITITPPAADGSNPRWDVIYVQVLDKSAIGTDASTDAVVGWVTGSPSAIPVVPTSLPDGAVPLANILRPATVSTISAANITDVRRSTALIGAARLMLPGDFASDAGKVTGDLRLRPATGSLPLLFDYWDGVQSKWRGTQNLTFNQVFPGTPNGAGQLVGTTSGSARLTVVTMTIPDPGWPYRVQTSAAIRLTGGTCNVYVSVNNGPFSSTITSVLSGDPGGMRYMVPTDSGIITGSAVLRLNIDPLSPFVTVSWSTDQRNTLTANVIPA